MADDSARYRKMYPRAWKSFRGLSLEEKAIAAYLLTGDQTNRIGLYDFSIGKAIEDLETLPQTFKKGFENVCQRLDWQYDNVNRVLYIPSWWKWNPPENPNVLVGNLKDLFEVATSPLYDEFKNNTEHLKAVGKGSFDLTETFTQTLAERYPKPYPKPYPKQQDQDQDQDQDQEKAFAPPAPGNGDARPLHQAFSCECFEISPEYLEELAVKFPLLPSEYLTIEFFPRMRDWCLDNRKNPKHIKKFDARGRLKSPRGCFSNWLKKEDPERATGYMEAPVKFYVPPPDSGKGMTFDRNCPLCKGHPGSMLTPPGSDHKYDPCSCLHPINEVKNGSPEATTSSQ